MKSFRTVTGPAKAFEHPSFVTMEAHLGLVLADLMMRYLNSDILRTALRMGQHVESRMREALKDIDPQPDPDTAASMEKFGLDPYSANRILAVCGFMGTALIDALTHGNARRFMPPDILKEYDLLSTQMALFIENYREQDDAEE